MDVWEIVERACAPANAEESEIETPRKRLT